MSKKPEVVVVVAAGLGAFDIGARIYYFVICHLLGAELVAPHWAGFGKIDETYARFESKLDELSAGGKHVVIIGHSLGAVLAAMYADKRSNVVRLMLIGIPGKGTIWCHLARPFGPIVHRFAPVIKAITPNSAFLAEMDQVLLRIANRTICVVVSFDLLVVPAKSCHVPGALGYLRLRIPLINHVNVVIHPRVIVRAKHLIKEAEAIVAEAYDRALTTAA